MTALIAQMHLSFCREHIPTPSIYNIFGGPSYIVCAETEAERAATQEFIWHPLRPIFHARAVTLCHSYAAAKAGVS